MNDTIRQRLPAGIAACISSVRSRFAAMTAILLSVVLGGPAHAIDILPRDYMALPSGTDLTGIYYLYGDYGPFNLAGGPTYTKNTGLQANIGVLRQIHYSDIGGHSWALQIIVPVATESDQIAGFKSPAISGLGDIVLETGLSFLPKIEPDHNVGVAFYVSLPTGSYQAGRSLNLGANRVSVDTQFGYTTLFANKFWFDLAVDGIAYTDNSNANLSGATLRQQPTWSGQMWLSYLPDPASLIGLGVATQFGGTQSIGGLANGVKTQSTQIRAAYQRFLSPTSQIAAQVARDVQVTGGFREDFGLTLRLVFFY